MEQGFSLCPNIVVLCELLVRETRPSNLGSFASRWLAKCNVDNKPIASQYYVGSASTVNVARPCCGLVHKSVLKSTSHALKLTCTGGVSSCTCDGPFDPLPNYELSFCHVCTLVSHAICLEFCILVSVYHKWV